MTPDQRYEYAHSLFSSASSGILWTYTEELEREGLDIIQREKTEESRRRGVEKVLLAGEMRKLLIDRALEVGVEFGPPE